MTFKELLTEIVLKNKERQRAPLAKTRLLKLAYLVEVFYYRRFSKRLLDIDWIYYLYGPWTSDYDSIIASFPFEIEERDIDEERFAQIVTIDEPVPEPPVSFDERLIIDDVLSRFGARALSELLEYVYFETEPMIKAENRLEHLDFSVVQPASVYRVTKVVMDKAVKAQVERKLRKKMAHG